MNEKQNRKKMSKFLSLVLRHKPESIGINLDENGWANTNELILKVSSSNRKLTLDSLIDIVENNDKKRFTFNDDKTKIRANQGHSINIDLELNPMLPPDILFHGTSSKFLKSIEINGLIKKSRNHVHLSSNTDTALKVGQRHGSPIIFEIDTKSMSNDGYTFYCSKNKVWLTNEVPYKYLKKLDSKNNSG